MAKCPPKLFRNVPPQAFDIMGGILDDNSLPVPKDAKTGKYKLTGMIRGKKGKVEVAYRYAPAKNELTIVVEKKPFIVGCDFVANKIGDFVKQAQDKA